MEHLKFTVTMKLNHTKLYFINQTQTLVKHSLAVGHYFYSRSSYLFEFVYFLSVPTVYILLFINFQFLIKINICPSSPASYSLATHSHTHSHLSCSVKTPPCSRASQTNTVSISQLTERLNLVIPGLGLCSQGYVSTQVFYKLLSQLLFGPAIHKMKNWTV